MRKLDYPSRKWTILDAMAAEPQPVLPHLPRTLDLVRDRWSLLILRDLYVGTSTFNGLARGLPGLSRSLLAKRLRCFEREGLVERIGGRYLMTERGRDLEGVLMALGQLGFPLDLRRPRARRSSTRRLLVWWMHGRLDAAPCRSTGGCCTSGSSTTRAGSGSSSRTGCHRSACPTPATAST